MDWITDRLPTESDADSDGHVLVQRELHAKPRHGVYFHWDLVCPGMSWTHSDWWRAALGYITNDKIAPIKPALAVGQWWRRRDGMVARITEYDAVDTPTIPFRAGNHWYHSDGTSAIGHSDADLVELIKPAAAEPESDPERVEIPEPISTGAAPFYVLVVGDDSGGKADGNPIVWETQIPAGSSLQAVLQQQQRVGSRYGTTYVAECRIIPELTEVPF